MFAVRGPFLVFVFLVSTVSYTNAIERIVGGSAAQINQFPFAAQLLVDELGNGNFVQDCGGSIISNRHVMTASHCFPGFLNAANRWRVRVGSTQRSSGGTIVQVSRLTLHPQYNPATFNNDIAIVTLQTTLTLGSSVAVASLPAANAVPRDNQQATVVGWGLTQFNGQPSENLLQTSVPIVNLVKCRSRYATVNMAVTNNMICAGLLGTGGRDACQKDSGGPLIYQARVHGIVSWGRECGHRDYPGVYTKVSLYLAWITSTMSST